MFGWPWRRPAVPVAPEPAPGPPAHAVEQPRSPGWRSVPALQRTVGTMPLTAPVQRLTSALSTWGDPRFLAPLGHVVDPEGPSGRVEGLLVPASPRPAPAPAADLPLAPPPPVRSDRRVPVQRAAVADQPAPVVVPAPVAEPMGTAVPDPEQAPGPTWHLPATAPGAPQVQRLTTTGPVPLPTPTRPVVPDLPVQRVPLQAAEPAAAVAEPVADAPAVPDDDAPPTPELPEVSAGQAVVAPDESAGGGDPSLADQQAVAPLVGSLAEPPHAVHDGGASPAEGPTVQRSAATAPRGTQAARQVESVRPPTATPLPTVQRTGGTPTAAAPAESATPAAPRSRRSRIGEPLSGPVDLQRLVAPPLPSSSVWSPTAPSPLPVVRGPLVGPAPSAAADLPPPAVGSSVQRATGPGPDPAPLPVAPPHGPADGAPHGSGDAAPLPVPAPAEPSLLPVRPDSVADEPQVQAAEPVPAMTEGQEPRPDADPAPAASVIGADAEPVEVAPLIAQRSPLVLPDAAVQRDADATGSTPVSLPTRSADGAGPGVAPAPPAAEPGEPGPLPPLRPTLGHDLVPVQRSAGDLVPTASAEPVRPADDAAAPSVPGPPLPILPLDVARSAASDVSPVVNGSVVPHVDGSVVPHVDGSVETTAPDTSTDVPASSPDPETAPRSDDDSSPHAEPPAPPLILAPVLAERPSLGTFLPDGARAPAVQRAVVADAAGAVPGAPAPWGARPGVARPVDGGVAQPAVAAAWSTPVVQRSADRVVQRAGEAHQPALPPPAAAPVRWVAAEPHLAPAMSGAPVPGAVAAPSLDLPPDLRGPGPATLAPAVQRSTGDPVPLGRTADVGHEPPPVLRTAPTASAVLQRATDPGAVAVALGLGHRDADGSVVFSAPSARDGGAGPALQRDAEAPATIQRAEDEVPDPGETPSVPGPSTAPTGGAPAAAPASSGTPDMDELARRLFDPLSARLRAELRLDRERAGISTDLRH